MRYETHKQQYIITAAKRCYVFRKSKNLHETNNRTNIDAIWIVSSALHLQIWAHIHERIT